MDEPSRLPYDVLLDVFDEVDFRNGKEGLEACRGACGLWREAAGDCEAWAAAKWWAVGARVRWVGKKTEGVWVLQDACCEGRLREAKHACRFLGLEAKDARADGNLALRWACENGHLEVVRWLHGTFGL